MASDRGVAPSAEAEGPRSKVPRCQGLIRVCVGVCLGLVASPLPAQDSMRAAATRFAGYQLDDGILESVVRGTMPEFSFKFIEADKVAKAQFGREGGNPSWGVAIAGPVDERAERTTLVTQEGLNSGFNAEAMVKLTGHTPRAAAFTAEDLCPRYRVSVIACARGDLPAELRALVDAGTWRAKWVLALSLKAGRRRFAFADPVTLSSNAVTKSGWSMAAGGGMFPKWTGPLLDYVGLSVRSENAWQAQAQTTICTPLGVPGATQCRQTAIGPPRRKETTLTSIESRHFLGSRIALAPRLTHAVREWRADVPMFMRHAAGDPFNGGLTMSWDSESRDITLSVFVGALPKLER